MIDYQKIINEVTNLINLDTHYLDSIDTFIGREGNTIYPYDRFDITIDQMFGRYGYQTRERTKFTDKPYKRMVDYGRCEYDTAIDALAVAMMRIDEDRLRFLQ